MWTDPPETEAEYHAHIRRLQSYCDRAVHALIVALWATLTGALLSAPYDKYVMTACASLAIAFAVAVVVLSSEIQFSTPPSPRR